MARGLSKIMVIGNLGRDPEMRFTPDGTPMTQFSVAVGRMASSSGGERREETDWFRVVAWRKLAETCNQYLTKGQRVYVEGRLQLREWQGQDGQTRQSAEIIASDVMFLSGPATASPLGPGGHDEGPDGGDMDADDLPF